MSDVTPQAFSIIILPPGSSSDDLQAAVDTAATGDTIVISSDISFTDVVTIPAGMEVTIQSDGDNHWTLSSDYRCFSVFGSLILNDITLDCQFNGVFVETGGSLTMNLGAVVQNTQDSAVFLWQNSRFTMNEGAVIQNCDAGAGSGVYMYYSTFDMTGGTIRGCWASDGSAAVFIGGGSTFTMSGGELSGNSVYGHGGAVEVTEDDSVFIFSGGKISENVTETDVGGGVNIQRGTFLISGGEISGNRAATDGGGVYNRSGSIQMSGGKISGNTADGDGGGIYLLYDGYNNSSLTVVGGEISNNTATGNGGGIYTMDPTYGNVNTGIDTVFQCNRAAAAFAPPPDAGTRYPEIQFASTTIADHPLNNFDLNYTEGAPIPEAYHVSYQANGGTGAYQGPDVASGATDTVLSADDAGIGRAGYTFTGWNTEPNGGGAEYSPGSDIVLFCNATLYAQWASVPMYAITYGGNGGSGEFVDPGRQYGASYTILSCLQTGIGRPGFTFTGWNTEADGSGVSFAPGDSITITDNVALYAQWRRNVPPKSKRCRIPATDCRMSIEGQKIWIDDNNAGGKRPPSVEILLLRDEEVYQRIDVDSVGDGLFAFCCLPKRKNIRHEYSYRIDETVPEGYTKEVKGYTVINTLTP